MVDLTFTRSGELDVTQIEGETEAGVDFVDWWIQTTMTIVDAGRIIVPSDSVTAIEKAALGRCLEIAHETLEAAI